MNIPNHLYHAVHGDKALMWQQHTEHLKRQIAEADGYAGCEAIVDRLREQLAATEAGVRRFETALSHLMEADERLRPAQQAEREAQDAHTAGSDDPKHALKLRDALEIASSARRHAFAAFEAARLAVPKLAGVPGDGNAALDTAKAIVNTMASTSIARMFEVGRSTAAIEPETWKRWLDLHDDFMLWCPFFVEKVCVEAERAWKAHKDDANRWTKHEPRQPNPEHLRAMWSELREARAARRAGRVAEAKVKLAQAEREAAI